MKGKNIVSLFDALYVLKLTPMQFFDKVITANDNNRDVFDRLVNRFLSGINPRYIDCVLEHEIREEVVVILKNDLLSVLLSKTLNINKVGEYGLTLEGVEL